MQFRTIYTNEVECSVKGLPWRRCALSEYVQFSRDDDAPGSLSLLATFDSLWVLHFTCSIARSVGRRIFAEAAHRVTSQTSVRTQIDADAVAFFVRDSVKRFDLLFRPGANKRVKFRGQVDWQQISNRSRGGGNLEVHV